MWWRSRIILADAEINWIQAERNRVNQGRVTAKRALSLIDLKNCTWQ